MENNPLLEKKRHSLAHILALAVLRIYGRDAKFGIGPAAQNGFFYDIEFKEPFNFEELKPLEKEMKKIVGQKLDFVKKELIWAEAYALFKEKKQGYKLKILDKLIEEEAEKLGKKIDALKKSFKVSTFTLGDFQDLCSGPHLKNSGEVAMGSFQLEQIAGAYWQGDAENAMLTRISGLAFETKDALAKYLALREEAKKRDHRKLGKELDLFCFSDLVGPGLPLFTPKGTVIKEELQKEVEKICRQHGFQKVSTPHLTKIDLYALSGHKQKFEEELFHVKSHHKANYVMKPVQCPHQTQIYASRPRSYRDLPIRYMESEKQYRDEKPGEISGLTRVIAITVEDGHSFCRVDQVKTEIKEMVEIIRDFYSKIGLWENHWVSLSVRDPKHPEKYIGEKEDWDQCEKILAEISDEMGLDAKRREGEAALYGPKLDFMFCDALGKEIQIPTVQIDFATPKRFGLVYTDEKGEKINPVMVHRAILGSYERFIALLIEHFAGNFPLWLAPVQVKVLSVSEKHAPLCEKIAERLRVEDIRFELDLENETVGAKIRKGITEKVPYLIVIGDKEAESGNLAVRDRATGKNEVLSPEVFLKKIKEIRNDRL